MLYPYFDQINTNDIHEDVSLILAHAMLTFCLNKSMPVISMYIDLSNVLKCIEFIAGILKISYTDMYILALVYLSVGMACALANVKGTRISLL